MKPAVAVHVFVDDAVSWPDRIRRCADCGHPEHNRRHDVPDMSEQQDEHRRRVGESEEQ